MLSLLDYNTIEYLIISLFYFILNIYFDVVYIIKVMYLLYTLMIITKYISIQEPFIEYEERNITVYYILYNIVIISFLLAIYVFIIFEIAQIMIEI